MELENGSATIGEKRSCQRVLFEVISLSFYDPRGLQQQRTEAKSVRTDIPHLTPV
jgi:hypothetical protein